MVDKDNFRKVKVDFSLEDMDLTELRGKEIKKNARDFVKKYYEGEYEAEMETYAKEHLKAQMYGFPFIWEDYDSFKPIIDVAYEKYAATKNK